jgi:hypothetical protein
LKLLGYDRFSGVRKELGSRKLQDARKDQGRSIRSDCITESKIDLNRNTRRAEIGLESHANTFILLIFFDPLCGHGIGSEDQAIILDRLSAKLAKDINKGFDCRRAGCK